MSRGDAGPVNPRLVGAVLALLGLAAVLFVLISAFYDPARHDARAGGTVFSSSALGHKAALEVLGRLGIDVRVNRDKDYRGIGGTGLVVVAEPSRAGATRFAETFPASYTLASVLLVLPKRGSAPQRLRRDRADRTWLLDPDHAAGAVAPLVGPLSVMRPAALPTCEGPWAPALADAQLLAPAERLEAVVRCGGGLLVAKRRVGTSDVWIVSDPDIIATHGLGAGDNAALFADVIARAADGRPVMWDEVVHGFAIGRNPWTLLLTMPVLPVTLLGVAAALALVASAAQRRAPARPVPPPLPAGTPTLVENLSGLFTTSGRGRALLARYRAMVLRDAALALHAPPGLSDAALVDWLEGMEQARGMKPRLRALHQRAAAVSNLAGAVRRARDLYRWKRRMVDGA